MDGAPAADSDARDSGLASLVVVARLHQLAADPAQLAHRFGSSASPLDATALVRAARWLGLKARRVESGPARLATTPLPALARTNDGAWLVLAAHRPDAVLVQRGGETAPVVLPLAAFSAVWSGELILVARRQARAGSQAFGFAWFVPFILRYRRYLLEVLAASLLLQVLALVTPLFFQVVIDKVLVHRGLTTLDLIALGLLLVSLFEVVLGGLRTYVLAHTTNRIDVALGSALFEHLLRLPLAWFAVRRVGDSVARVRELETLRGFITGSSLTVLVDSLFTGVFLVVLYAFSPLLTAVVAATIPLYVLLALGLTPPLRARLNEKFERGADNHAFLVETVGGMRTLKGAAVEPALQRRFEERLAAYVSAAFRSTTLGAFANQAAALINKLMVFGILWLGAHRVMDGALSVGQLVAFNMLAGRVSGPILRLVQLWQDFQQAGISLRRLGDVLDATPEPAHRPGRGSLPALAGAVRFEAVHFRYRPQGPDVLRRLDLAVSAGEVIGIVGRSGSGKSTLAALLQRLYVPQGGRVLVDGVDLALLDPAWLRRQLGVVPQEALLFNRTVRENIALADPALPLERVVSAARLAGAHEFVLDLPDGYDSLVGEGGANLSGGQRQRLALARALVGEPRILVLDEATSALDYESEAVIQRNMREICAGRTVFIIAHRLSAVRPAGRILVLDEGRILEQGPHETLLAAGGYYAGLYRQQRGVPA